MDLSGSWEYIQSIARSRLAHNRTPRHVSAYGDGIEVLGVAGELCARRFLGLDEKVHEGFDHGIDIDYCGKAIDVKATVLTPKVNFRRLQWPLWKRVKADLVLFTAIDPITMQGAVIGYATKDEVLNSPVNVDRCTPCHEIPISDLHPAWELIMERVRLTERSYFERKPYGRLS
jgi:hypothetical protein